MAQEAVTGSHLTGTEDAVAQLLQELLHTDFNTQAKPENPNALKPGVEVVACDNTANWFPRDPLAEIYHFRGIHVDALGWREHIKYMNTPFKGLHSETDNSDMQGTVYFVKRFMDGKIACVVRYHPPKDTYGRDISMIGLNLPHLLSNFDPETKTAPGGVLLDKDIYETSRVIVDDDRLPRLLPDGSRNPDRSTAVEHCMAGSILAANEKGIKGFFCFMPEFYWKGTYIKYGMEVTALGDVHEMQDTPDSEPYPVYAGYMLFTPEAMQRVRQNTGFTEDMLNFGPTPTETIRNIVELAVKLKLTDPIHELLPSSQPGALPSADGKQPETNEHGHC